MTYVLPRELTNITTNVDKQDYEEYSQDKTYNTGDKTTILANNKNYICTKDSTKGINPALNKDVWIETFTNAYAMFTSKVNSITKNVDVIDVSFNADFVDCISLLNVDADSVEIKIYVSQELIFSKNIDLDYTEINDFNAYLFEEKEYKDRLHINPPFYRNMQINIKIKKIGSIAKCGYVIVGKQEDIGATILEGKLELSDFSEQKRNSWGEMELKEGNSFIDADIAVIIPRHDIDRVFRRLNNLKGKPTLFIADESDNISNLKIFGTYDKLIMPFNSNITTTYDLRIQSIIESEI